MFGIMQPEHSCSIDQQDPIYRQHRLHYCGTCKAISRDYGQKARLLLNFDTVFLAELLSDVLEEDSSQWEQSLQAINKCFTLPGKNSDIPFSLDYAASVNVLLASLKLEDHKQDHRLPFFWNLLQQFFSRSFRKLEKHFLRWQLDIKDIKRMSAEQQQIEKTSKKDFDSTMDLLLHYAAPTAEITGILFRQAMYLNERPELEANFYQLGYQFGCLAYVLDAIEDRAEDMTKNHFNPFRLLWDNPIDEKWDADLEELIMELQQNCLELIAGLQLPEHRTEIYAGRLMTNVLRKLNRPQFIPLTLKQRIRHRWNHARDFAEQMTCSSNSRFSLVRMHLITLAVFFLPRTPEYFSQAESFSWLSYFTAMLASFGIGAAALGQHPLKPIDPQKQKKKRCRPRFWRRKKRTGPCSVCCNPCEQCCSTCVFFVVASVLGALILGIISIVIIGAVNLLNANYTYGWVIFALGAVASIVIAAMLFPRKEGPMNLCTCRDSLCLSGRSAKCCDIGDGMREFMVVVLVALIITFIIALIVGIIVLSSGVLATGWTLLGISVVSILALLFLYL